jgi:predicted ATP-grasp superfamily ATP-dependent carboligase
MSVIRPLVWSGVPIVVGTDDPNDHCLRSRHVRTHFLLPGYGDRVRERSADVLRRIGERMVGAWKSRIPLFYGSDAQLALLYDHQAALEPFFRFVLTDAAVGRAMLDKLAFASLCERRGVPALRTCQLDGGQEQALSRLRPPLLVKPRLKTDWHRLRDALFDGHGKARVYADAAHLLRDPVVQGARDALVVQEYVDASVSQLYSFHGFTGRDGRLLASFCGRKVSTYPPFAGESAVIELVREPRVEALGRAVIAKLGVIGPFKVDFIEAPPSHDLVTLEVNARFNLWHHLGAAHGVNLLQVAYDYLMFDRQPLERAYQPRARWLSFYRVYRGFRDAGHGQPGALARWMAMSLRRSSIHDVFEWRDPGPFLSLLHELSGMGRPVPAKG